MAIITLTSDFGNRDYSISMVKGMIYQELENPKIIDITHEVEPYNLLEAAYVLRNSFQSFPKQSVHIMAVDSLYYPHARPIIAEIDGHYFISNNNGILSLIANEIRPTKVIDLEFIKKDFFNFILTEIFVPAACHIIRGGKMEILGNKTKELIELTELKPITKSTQIMGQIIYIDNYGNAISNINYKIFREIGKNREFEIICQNYKFNKILKYYSEIVTNWDAEKDFHGKRLAIFNKNNFLEIALYKSNKKTVGGANTLLGLSIGTPITINFI